MIVCDCVLCMHIGDADMLKVMLCVVLMSMSGGGDVLVAAHCIGVFGAGLHLN